MSSPDAERLHTAFVALLLKTGAAPENLRDSPDVVDWFAEMVPGAYALDVISAASWQLLQTAVARESSEARGSKEQHNPLAAARHLLGLASYPDDCVRDTGMTVDQVRKLGILVKNDKPKRYSLLRQRISSIAGGYGDDASNLRETHNHGKNIYEVIDALTDKLKVLVSQGELARLADEWDANRRLELQGNSSPGRSERAARNRRMRLSRRKKWLILGLAVFVALVGIVVMFSLSRSPRVAAAGGNSQLVQIKAHSLATPFDGQYFWVPASAPIDTLTGTSTGFCDVDYADSETKRDVRSIEEWLTTYGTPQYDSKKLTIHNVSGLAGDLGVSHVIARGKSSAKVTPAFIFNCPSAKGGGLDWVEVGLNLNGSEAVETWPKQPVDYFWLNLPRGEADGLEVDLSGTKDFSGIVTATIDLPTGTTHTVALPLGKSGGDKISWHGIPADRLLIVSVDQSVADPSSTEFSCSDPQFPAPATFPCNRVQIESLLKKLWSGK